VSIIHRAFVFDVDSFISELSPMLTHALTNNNVEELRRFIATHARILKDPYEGESLIENWEDGLEVRDAHQYGDIALTKYYDLAADIGLGSKWLDLDRLLPENDRPVLLGRTLGRENNPFDPGKSGSYFQTKADLVSSLSRLELFLHSNPKLRPDFSKARRMLQCAADSKIGLYVTF